MEGGIRNVRFVGKGDVLVELEREEGKREVMRRRGKLKGTKIFLDDDLTREEREIQRELIKRAKEMREQGKKVWMRFQKLRVDG